MTLNRISIPTAVGMLVVLLAVLSMNLQRQLRDLSTAGAENLQWTILQVDTETGNLLAALLAQAAKPEPDDDEIRLRTDIALSRIQLVHDGNARDIFAGNAEAQLLLARLDAYASGMVEIVDDTSEISRAALARLVDLTTAIRPDARRLALIGITAGARRAEENRLSFANHFRLTGVVAIIVVGALSISLIILNQLLSQARQRDQALALSTARLAATVGASLDAIVTTDAGGMIVDLNSPAETILGWSRADIIGRNLQDAIFPPVPDGETDPREPRHLAGLRQHANSGRTEVLAKRKDGETFPAEISITAVQDCDEHLFVIYLRDISDQKISAQKLIDARDRAEQADRAKSRFITVMSHEMRTPLNGILGVLDLLRTTKLSAQQRRHVRVATGSGEILLEHINEALDIARIESGSMTLSSHRFDLADTVSQAAAALEPLGREKALNFDVAIAPDMAVDFIGDGMRIRQIVTNLIGNAIKFTDAGTISVTVSGVHAAGSTDAIISVRDTGTGIPAEHAERIFEDFVALANAQGRQSRGDGLGLSISRKLARLMGGDLTVMSTPGEGSAFTLALPLSRPAEFEPSNAPSGLNSGTQQHVPPRRVMVVEDNAINLSVLTEMLTKLGHDVQGAANGSAALELADRSVFDLILMDINIPIIDGIEATQRIRHGDGPNRETRIHGLTAYGEEEFGHAADLAGMNGLTTKPIRLGRLQEIVGGATDELSSENASSAKFDDDVIEELLEALGADRIHTTADRFFSELDSTMQALKDVPSHRDTSIVFTPLHKLRGAADLLGLRSLSRGLEQLQGAAHAEDFDGYCLASNEVDKLAISARRHLHEVLAHASQV